MTDKMKKQKLNPKQIVGICITSVAALLLIFMVTGLVPAVSGALIGCFGISAYGIFLAALLLGIFFIMNRSVNVKPRYIVNFAFMYFIIILLVHAMTSSSLISERSYTEYLDACFYYRDTMVTMGGAFGGIFIYPLYSYIKGWGTYIFLTLALIATIIVAMDFFFKRAKGEAAEKESGDTVEIEIPTKEELAQRLAFDSSESDKTEFFGESVAKATRQPDSRELARKQLFGDLDLLREKEAFSSPSENSVQNRFDTAHISYGNGAGQTAPPKIIHDTDALPHRTDGNSYYSETVREEEKLVRQRKESLAKDLRTLKSDGLGNNKAPIINGDEVSRQIREGVYGKEKTEIPAETVESPAEEFAPETEHVFMEVSAERYDASVPPKDEINDIRVVEQKEKDFILADETHDTKEKSELSEKETECFISEQPKFDDDKDEAPIEFSSLELNIEETPSEPKAIEVEKKDIRFTEKPFVSGSKSKGVQIGIGIKEEKEEHTVHIYQPYDKPPVEILDDSPMKLDVNAETNAQKSKALEDTLSSLKIDAKVVNVINGPTVTRYELELAPGISVRKIKSLDEDIAMRLSSSSGGVRLQTPIPGKNLFGIEVPNSKGVKVPIRVMIDSDEFWQAKGALTFVVGIDIAGRKVMADLADMPHLMIAGSTGSGKSICLNGIIVSLLYKYSPEELRFILIDPKKVEFTTYEGLPHLLIDEIICENEKALKALQWMVDEMERRYVIFSETGVRDIASYNAVVDPNLTERLPRIVLVIDELADFMMYNKNEVEAKIKKLTAKARAAGIHLILATQRPSVNVITGDIKSNIATRIALKLPTPTDSSTILAQGGAEKLLGKGDMLFMSEASPEPVRLQGSFISTEEVTEVVSYLKEHNETHYNDNAIKKITHSKQGTGGEGEDKETDPYFYDALKYCIEKNSASISMLQRRFNIGYNRAGKIVEDMERKQFVSGYDGMKSRQMLITMEEYNNLFGDD